MACCRGNAAGAARARLDEKPYEMLTSAVNKVTNLIGSCCIVICEPISTKLEETIQNYVSKIVGGKSLEVFYN